MEIEFGLRNELVLQLTSSSMPSRENMDDWGISSAGCWMHNSSHHI